MRKLLLLVCISLSFATCTALAIEGGAGVYARWQQSGLPPPVREANHCEYDPELGWRHANNKRVPDLYGAGLGLTTNGQHMRGPRDHAPQKPADAYRILCLGDSFTMGYGVADDETYPALLAGQQPGLDTINMGLGGYGLDQCYLWYRRDGVQFQVDALLFAFIVGDFYRMNPEGNVADIPKPVLDLVDNEPVALNVPVVNALQPTFGKRVQQVWHTSSLYALLPKTFAAPTQTSTPTNQQRFAPIALRMFEILRDQSKQRGQLFTLALLPVLEEVHMPRLDLVDGWLLPALAERGIPLIDVRPAFRAVPKSELVECFTQGHYSKRGNLIAAKALLDGLRALDPKCPR